jgi:NAD(P)-dependent dehydrogenase (short-subunit alcohol dehydrogenase family)
MTTEGIAVVTGASAGVGRATAVGLAHAGYDVGVVARGAAGLDGVARDVRQLGRRCIVLPADVAEHGEVEAAATRAEQELGPIDIWVNDAMTTTFSPLADIAPSDFRRAVEVTFLGQVWGTMVALDLMRPRDQGTIVNIGSALAFIGIPLQSAYCASKFACRGFFDAVRAELIHDGSKVRLSMVHLPAVNTPQFDWCRTTMPRRPQPVPPIYQPEDVARSIVQVALEDRRRVEQVARDGRPGRTGPGQRVRGESGVGRPAHRPLRPRRPSRQPARAGRRRRRLRGPRSIRRPGPRRLRSRVRPFPG